MRLAPFEFNGHGVWAIYKFEIARALRTLVQSLVTPVITTSLYFVVFGAAIGSRMTAVSGVSYGAFIVPGLNSGSALGQPKDDEASPTSTVWPEKYN